MEFKMEKLDKNTFIEKVFDFEKEKEWKYRGAVPAIIDFYADWCGPCKMVAPILEKVSAEYEGKLVIYKVDTDKEQELAGAFGIQSIPSLLFIPLAGQPQMVRGAMDRPGFDKAISDILGVKKES
jgi:thioredoxin 1